VKLTCVIINRNNFRARNFNQIQIPARETSRSLGSRLRLSPLAIRDRLVGKSIYSRAILAYYKKKWDKFCQFFGKFHNIGKISMMFRKILVCPKNFWTPKMAHWPKFFLATGGGSRPNKFSPENFFGTCRAKSEKSGKFVSAPPNFFLPVRPCYFEQFFNMVSYII
jgi:hypothetical protein